MNVAATGEHARTWLFVPGDRPDRFDRAADSGADVVLLDLEDAVPSAHKAAARQSVSEWLAETSVACAFRVNAVGTRWHEADLTAIAGGGPLHVMLPKAEDPAAVAELVAALPEESAVVALVETARGVACANELAVVPGVVRLALGSYDLAAELGVDPDNPSAMAYTRGVLVMASAVGRLAGPVDGVTGDIRDTDQLVADVTRATALGFSGKLCIHPAQVAPAAAALAPPPEDVAWARRVLAVGDNDGVAVVDGRMVDRPVVDRARRVLTTAHFTERGKA
jgi:citrate lyase subunit beta/citryl-CoA lyase